MNPNLHNKAEALPAQPGVYVFKDESGKPIYVGKAKSLRARVRSYFLESRSADEKRDLMLDAAHDLETILVDNEHEAMALEYTENIGNLSGGLSREVAFRCCWGIWRAASCAQGSALFAHPQTSCHNHHQFSNAISYR